MPLPNGKGIDPYDIAKLRSQAPRALNPACFGAQAREKRELDIVKGVKLAARLP
jgi:hypothetical protein